jgi:hypothetical protein
MAGGVWTNNSSSHSREHVWKTASLKSAQSLSSDLAGLDAGGTHIQALGAAGDNGPDTLDIRIPAPIGLLLRPGHVVAEARSLSADVTHGSHWGSLPLDCDLGPTSGQPRNRTRALHQLTNYGEGESKTG